jgi:hypothetical protein
MLRCLENSAAVLDSVSDQMAEGHGFAEISDDEQLAIVKKLTLVSEMLRVLAEGAAPHLGTDTPPRGGPRPAAAHWLARIKAQARTIEQRLKAAAVVCAGPGRADIAADDSRVHAPRGS